MNSKQPVLRLATLKDVPILQAVALQAYRDHYLHLWHDDGAWYMQRCFSAEQLTHEIAGSNARFYMVYVDEQPVGFVKLNINAPLDDVNENALELERIYFTKQASGKGVGSVAMQYIFALATKLGKQTVWLKVMDSSTVAIAFYKKHGFITGGTSRLDYPQMKEELRGMYVMRKELN